MGVHVNTFSFPSDLSAQFVLKVILKPTVKRSGKKTNTRGVCPRERIESDLRDIRPGRVSFSPATRSCVVGRSRGCERQYEQVSLLFLKQRGEFFKDAICGSLKLLIGLAEVIHVGLIESPGFVHALCELIQIAAGATDVG